MAEAHYGFEDVAGEAHGSDLLVSFGPTILVDIGFDPGYLPAQTASAPLAGLTAIQARS